MTPESADDRARAFLRERRWFATITVNLAMISSIMSSTMTNVALPDIMGAHGVGQDIAHWLSTGFISAPSARLSNSLPSAEAHGGKHAVSPVPPAVYGYMLACTSTPAARAESIFAMASPALPQLRRPPALRW